MYLILLPASDRRYRLSSCLITFRPECRMRLFAHYTILLPQLCRLIQRHWICQMFVSYILSNVCLRLGQTFQLSLCNIWSCAFSAYPCLSLWLRDMRILSYYFHQIGSVNRLGVDHETRVYAVCLAIFVKKLNIAVYAKLSYLWRLEI